MKYEIFILLKTCQALLPSTEMKLILLLLIQIMAGNPELTSILQNAVPLLLNSVPGPPEKSWFLSIKTPKFLKICLQFSLLFNNESGKTSLYLQKKQAAAVFGSLSVELQIKSNNFRFVCCFRPINFLHNRFHKQWARMRRGLVIHLCLFFNDKKNIYGTK